MTGDRSIRRAMMRSVTLVLILVYGLGSLGVFLLVRSSVRSQFDARLTRQLQEMIDGTQLEITGKIEGEYHELAETRVERGGTAPTDDEQSGFFYQLRDAGGATVLRSMDLRADVDLPFAPATRVEESDRVVFSNFKISGQPELRIASASFSLPLDFPDEEIPETPEELAFRTAYDPTKPENRMHLSISASDAPVRDTLTSLAVAQLFVGLLIAVGTFFLMSREVARACRPIDDLAAITGSIRPSDLGKRLPTDEAPAELLPLVTRFNQLLDQIEQALRRERRFATDISHELRNPVAELRCLAEVAMVSAGEDESLKEDPQVIYADMADISQRLGSIIDVLSDLHRAQSQAFSLSLGETDASQIVQQSVSALADAATKRDITVEFSTDGTGEANGSMVVTDPHLLRSILDNLLGNAIAHSTRGSQVLCSLEVAGDRALQLRISNTTESLTREDLPHLREPFWRKDRARSDREHFGLGLSLVDAYTQLLGGKIDLSIEHGQFVAVVNLPAAAVII